MPATTSSPIGSLANENAVDHRHQSALSEEFRVNVSTQPTFRVPSHNSTNSSNLGWRPFYLHRFVLLSFILVFTLIIVTIEALLAISNRDQGLVTTTSSKHYLWTYSPTAFLTVLASIWALTEYQSKLAAPWMRLSQNSAPASHTIVLDYVSQFSLFTIFTALRKRDFMVSIAITVSLILKILITISTSLISLSWIGLNQNSYSMLLRDKFVDSNAKLATLSETDYLATYIVRGLRNHNFTLPDGISNDYAFQSVQTDLPDTAETQVTVDGLVNSLKCEPVEVTLAGAGSIWTGTTHLGSLNVIISSPMCNVSLANLDRIGKRNLPYNNSTLFARFKQIQCDTIPGDSGKRVLVIFGNITYFFVHSVAPLHPGLASYGSVPYARAGTLNQSTNLLCVPEYTIDRVQVTRNATRTTSVVPIPGVPRKRLESVTAWNIMEAQFITGKLTAFEEVYGLSTNVLGVPVDTDLSMLTAITSQLAPGSQAIDLFDVDVLWETAARYYQQIGAIFAKQYLMSPTSMDAIIQGSATLNTNRLMVRSWIAHWMAALVTVCIVLTVIALFIVPSKWLLPCSPTKFSNLISILQQSHEFSARLQNAGVSDNKHFVNSFEQSTFRLGISQDRYCVIDVNCARNGRSNQFPQVNSKFVYPTILHPAYRFILCLLIAGLIIALELLLHKSTLEHGLSDVDNNTYIQYTWTAIPALILGGLSMAFSAIDFQLRNLAPYMALKRCVPQNIFKRLELLDMTVPVVIYQEIKLGAFWATASTTALLIASLFTTFSASLLQDLSIPIATSQMLQPNRSFAHVTYPYSGIESVSCSEIPSLILEGNYSFPRFTYMDLAFSELKAINTLPATFDEYTASVSAVIPAIRPRMECIFYKPNQIQTLVKPIDYEGYNATGPTHYISVTADGLNPLNLLDFGFPNGVNRNTTYIGGSAVDIMSGVPNDLIHFWAELDVSANVTFRHVAILTCDVTLEALDVYTTFVGTDFDLDLRNLPQPLENTVRNTTLNDGGYVPEMADDPCLAAIDVDPQFLNPFFTLLVSSPWAIPISALGDPSKDDDVIAAIQLHQRIVITQRIALQLSPANETNSTLVGPIGPGDNDAQRIINATVIDTTSRRRIIQDAASTHILVALLAAALVLFIISWVASPSANVLPREPTTIASVAALLAGGNIFDRLPRDMPPLTPEEAISALGGPEIQFWMGWGDVAEGEGGEHGGENEAGVSRFGIFVIDKEEVHQP